MGPTWVPSGADRTQVGPMLAPWTLLSGWVLFSYVMVILSSVSGFMWSICPYPSWLRHWSWWRHQMETFSELLAHCAGNSSPVNSPHKGQWCGALVFSLICAWINGWVNTREAGDLRRHRAHYDVTVMYWGNRMKCSDPKGHGNIVLHLTACRNKIQHSAYFMGYISCQQGLFY